MHVSKIYFIVRVHTFSLQQEESERRDSETELCDCLTSKFQESDGTERYRLPINSGK